jgi:hypothetical protein
VLSGAQTEPALEAAAGVIDDPVTLMESLRWLTLRVGGPLGKMTPRDQTGAMPLAAAYAVEGLQRLLGVCAAGQDFTETTATSVPPTEMTAARQALSAAIANIDILRSADTPPLGRTTG